MILKKYTLMIVSIIFCSFLFAQSNKPVVGVGSIEYAGGRGGNVSSWAAELEGNLLGTNKFEIIERNRLKDILQERALSASGIVDGNASYGGVSGIDYIIYGTIISIDSDYGEDLFGDMGYSVEGTLLVKVVDVNTGRIVMNSKIKESSYDKDEDTGVSEVRTLLCKKVAKDLAFQIFPIKIASVQGNKVYINYGFSAINSTGAYQVVELGGGFVDPDTGDLLGAEETYVGVVEIESRHSAYSIGKIRHKVGDIKVGDKLKWMTTKKYRALRKKYKIK